MVLNIGKRPAKLGGHLNARTEKHGEENVGAVDLSLSGILIDEGTLNVLMNDDQAHEFLFRGVVDADTGEASTDALNIHPRFRGIKSLSIDDVFEEAKIQIYTGRLRKPKLSLLGTLKKLKLRPMQGGLTEFVCQFQTTPDSDDVATLFDVMNKDIEVEISDAERVEEKDEDQPELPMSHSQDEIDAAEQEEAEATAAVTGGKKRRGRK